MLHLLVIAGLVALGAAEAEVEPAAAANPVYVHQDEVELLRRGHEHSDNIYGARKVVPILGKTQRLKSTRCPCTGRPLDTPIKQVYFYPEAHVSGDTLHKQHHIIESVYSPDYYEPTLILDYRYLKSGGRDYTRGPGGQILILPHGIHSHQQKDHRDYDSLIEFLRLRHLAQSQAKRQRQEDEEHAHLKHADVLGHAQHDRKQPERWY